MVPFLVQVWESGSRKHAVNMTESWPEFIVKGLEPGHSYFATVMAYNSKGNSPAAPLELSTAKEVPVSKSELTSWYSLHLYYLVVLSLLKISILFLLWLSNIGNSLFSSIFRKKLL